MTLSTSEDSNYRHLFVIIEHEEGKPIPVSLEMLGEARRLMDHFNKKYSSNEKVVAIVLGNNVRKLCEELIFYGADAVIYAEDPELQYPRNIIDTKIISQIAMNRDCIAKISSEDWEQFKKPRYMFFAADNIGRHLSSTVLAELESGLASDINKLVVEDLEIKHEHKTKGQMMTYTKTLEMYRPDFSGFLWTTILCLDNRNPTIQREYHPQACSIIPGVFAPLVRDTTRNGIIVDYAPKIEKQDLNVKILSRKVIKSAVDFDTHKAIISFGRVIGTSGRKVSPLLYIAVGISGAMQHIAGMKDSEFVIAINTDENSPIRDECDIFIKGRMDEVIPVMIEELRKQKELIMGVRSK